MREGDAIEAMRCIVAEERDERLWAKALGGAEGVQATEARADNSNERGREQRGVEGRKDGRKEGRMTEETVKRRSSFFSSFFFFLHLHLHRIRLSHQKHPPSRPLLIIIHLQAHSVVDLVVGESDVVLEDRRPLLEPDLVGPRAGLRGRELLQVADGVVLVALDSDLLAEAVVEDDLDHSLSLSLGVGRALVRYESQGPEKRGAWGGGLGVSKKGRGATEVSRGESLSIVLSLLSLSLPLSGFVLSPQLTRRGWREDDALTSGGFERGDSGQNTVRTEPMESVEFLL